MKSAERIRALQQPKLPEIDLSLDRVLQLLRALGSPHEKLPPVIHVAGTNGKGSVIAYLRAIYTNAGYWVHAYTSPHLVSFNERILVRNEPISDAMLLASLERVTEIMQKENILATFFEATTAAAFLVFSENPSDLLLLETGLGGRLDATNVVLHPLCTVITPIGRDHTEFLGDTLACIAMEKAGIMKTTVPCVVQKQPPEVIEVIKNHARRVGAELILGKRDWNFVSQMNGFMLEHRESAIYLPFPNLSGAHQIANAALAVEVALTCADKLPVPEASLSYGVTHAHWPARLQMLSQGPIVEQWKGSVVLDGAHNVHAAEAIAQWVAGRPFVAICAMMKRKEAQRFFKILAPHIQALCCIPIQGESNAYTEEELAVIARGSGVRQVMRAKTVLEAVAILGGYANTTLLITGSLYLAGEVLKNHS